MMDEIKIGDDGIVDHNHTITIPEYSDWKCDVFGADIIWSPLKGNVPNRFVRWMSWLFFRCKWTKIDK